MTACYKVMLCCVVGVLCLVSCPSIGPQTLSQHCSLIQCLLVSCVSSTPPTAVPCVGSAGRGHSWPRTGSDFVKRDKAGETEGNL